MKKEKNQNTNKESASKDEGNWKDLIKDDEWRSKKNCWEN